MSRYLLALGTLEAQIWVGALVVLETMLHVVTQLQLPSPTGFVIPPRAPFVNHALRHHPLEHLTLQKALSD